MRLVKGVMAGLLALTMTLSLMPQTVFAEETTDSQFQYDVPEENNEEKTEEYDVPQENGETDPEEQDVTQEDNGEKTEDLASEVTKQEEKEQTPSLPAKAAFRAYSAKSNTVASWNDLKTAVEGASADTTISISGRIVKSSSDERITIPAGVEITLTGTDAVIVRPSTSDVGEFYVGDNARLTLQGNYVIEADKYDQGKGTLAHANFVEVSENGTFSLEGSLKANTSDGFFNGKYGVKGLIYCQGQMLMSDQSSISGWTVYDTTSRADSRNAAVVLDGAKASFVMDGGEITGNYNVGSNAVAGAAVQVHNGASFVMNNGNIHDNGVIAKPKDNVHYGAGVFVYGENSSFKMTGGAIQSNNGMVGAGVYVYGSLNGKASFEMTGGRIDDNSITNVGKYACDGGGIYAKYANIDILGKENAKISISNNGTKDFGTEYNSAQSSGGGIYAEKSAVNLNYVVIDHNTACGNNTQGGAGIWTKDSDVTIKGGSISDNQGGKYNQNVYGGALRIEGSGNVYAEAVTFENNRVSPESDYQWNVGHGGAIMMNGEGTLVLQDCVIKGNHASGSGGGIYANQGVTEIKGSTVIEGNTCNNNREKWKDWLGEAICITSIATVKVYDQVQIDKENTVGLESDRNGIAVLTMANAYTGIDEEHPVAIESMSQDVEQLPDTKGTPLVTFLDEAGGEQGAAYADERHHFIVSSYMPATLHIGQSEETKNILTYVANRAPVIQAEDKTLTVGDKFEPLEGVSAKDAEDGDLTSAIEIAENEVDTSKSGVYTVTYQVTDSNGVSVTKTIKVTVKGKGTPTVPNDPDTPNKPNKQNTANTPGDNKSEAAGSVATGDHANMAVWVVLLAISGVGALSVYRKKRRLNP